MGGVERINAFIRENGYSFEVTESELDGGWHTRYTLDGRKIWFRGMRLGELTVFRFGNWRTKKRFKFVSAENLTSKESRLVNKFDKQIDKERSEKQLQAKGQAEELFQRWSTGGGQLHQSDYLLKKGLVHRAPAIVCAGEEDAQKLLVVPMFDETGELWNFQRIFRSGKKVFHTKGKTKGLHHVIEGVGDVVLLGEGYATGLAAWTATGFKTYVAFNTGNLELVLKLILKTHPAGSVVLLADWDGETFEKSGENPGMLAAQELALKYKIKVAQPQLKDTKANVDFADNWVDGIDIVSQLARADGYAALADGVFKVKREREYPKLTNDAAPMPTPQAVTTDVVTEIPAGAKLRTVQDYSHIIKAPDKGGWLPNYDALAKSMLPDVQKSNNGTRVLGTLRNFQVIMDFVGATLRYNVILKDQEWFIPGETASVDNYMNALYGRVVDLCARVGFPLGQVDHYLTYLCEQQQFNPVATWIESKPWDGVSRLEGLYKTVVVKDEENDGRLAEMKRIFIRKWMIMAIEAAYNPRGIAAPGMLVFQGPQYIGKTKWLLSLVPAELNLAVESKQVNPADKDSVKETVCFWLVELGELDGVLKRSEQAALKAFITRQRDMFRPPYAKKQCNFARRTVFFGSVNEQTFLTDPTGNRRYWTLPVTTVDWNHGLDMQQIWAELKVQHQAGAQWWLTDEEMVWLNKSNAAFETLDPIEEELRALFDWDDAEGCELTATQICKAIGIEHPKKSDVNACAAVVRKLAKGRVAQAKSHKGGRKLWVGRRISAGKQQGIPY
jgi:putative DNA primase/helicase